MSILVYVCAPLGGNVKHNMKRVRQAVEKLKEVHSSYWSHDMGSRPFLFVPHFAMNGLTFHESSELESDREHGMRMCLHMVRMCDEMCVVGNEITKGMREEIDEAHKWSKKIWVLEV
jgi:hypothetical protein